MKKYLLLLTFLISICSTGYSQCTPTVSITADHTAICAGNPITYTATSTNEGTAPLYEWFINNVSQGTPNPISTFTTNSLTASFNSVSVQLTSNATCVSPVQATSNVIQTTVFSGIDPGVIGSDQTICLGTIPSAITEVIASAGASGAATYSWESSPNNAWPWTQISGGANTATSYTPSALTSDMYYRRIITDFAFVNTVCNSSTSNSVHIQVIPTLVSTVTVNDPGPICEGSALNYIATTATGGTYQWYIGTTPVGTNNATYTYISDFADNGKQVTVKLTSSLSCSSGPVTSLPVTLNIATPVTPTVTVYASLITTCVGLPVTFTFMSNSAGAIPIYQWYINSSPVGTNSTTFTTTELSSSTDQVWVTMTSSIACIVPGAPNPATSNKVSIIVKPIPTPQITQSDQTICTGESFTFSGTNNAAGSTLQWKLNNSGITGATNSSYTATQAGQYTLIEDNGSCNITTSPATLTIDPCSDFSTSITGPNTVTPGQQNVAYSVVNQTGFSYVWTVAGGTIASGQNTNAILVDWDGGSSSNVSRTATSLQEVSVKETKQSTKLSKTTSLNINNTATVIITSLAQSGIQFYPNPAVDAFNIVMPQSGTLVQYTISDLTGTAVANGIFTSTGGAEKITTTFNAGLYQVVLKYNETTTCIRLNKVQ